MALVVLRGFYDELERVFHVGVVDERNKCRGSRLNENVYANLRSDLTPKTEVVRGKILLTTRRLPDCLKHTSTGQIVFHVTMLTQHLSRICHAPRRVAVGGRSSRQQPAAQPSLRLERHGPRPPSDFGICCMSACKWRQGALL